MFTIKCSILLTEMSDMDIDDDGENNCFLQVFYILLVIVHELEVAVDLFEEEEDFVDLGKIAGEFFGILQKGPKHTE